MGLLTTDCCCKEGLKSLQGLLIFSALHTIGTIPISLEAVATIDNWETLLITAVLGSTCRRTLLVVQELYQVTVVLACTAASRRVVTVPGTLYYSTMRNENEGGEKSNLGQQRNHRAVYVKY